MTWSFQRLSSWEKKVCGQVAQGGERCLRPEFRGLHCQPLRLTRGRASLGDTSACCVVTESDPELEVEYRESRELDLGPAGLDSASLSDADTVNPDEDSFSILGGDSPTGPESFVHDLPPLFLHLTCSVRLRGQHSSVPVCSLPTCLGEWGCPAESRRSWCNRACLLRGVFGYNSLPLRTWGLCLSHGSQQP